MMGKGSTRRPTDSKQFENNWDKIFNSKPNAEQFDNIRKKEEWREEIIKERDEEYLKEKDNGNKPNTENAKKT